MFETDNITTILYSKTTTDAFSDCKITSRAFTKNLQNLQKKILISKIFLGIFQIFQKLSEIFVKKISGKAQSDYKVWILACDNVLL